MADCDFLLNPEGRDPNARGLFDDAEYEAVRRFFRARPDLPPTPLVRLRALAARLGIGELLVKDESARFGLSAFKIVGVKYALEAMIEAGLLPRGSVVACATAGNHGLAVSRTARAAGLRSRVYVSNATVAQRRRALLDENADLVVIDGTYDDAVARMAEDAGARGWNVISDTSWEGYEDVPRRIMAGYTWILEEARSQAPYVRPDVILVQGGVGGLVCAAASWSAATYGSSRPFFVACEPTNAACLMASAREKAPARSTGNLDTVMAGLRCSGVSPAAWPAIQSTVDAFVSIDDAYTEDAMRRLATPFDGDPRVIAGASGACGLGALLAVLTSDRLQPVRAAAQIDASTRVMIVNTEGNTDPEHTRRVLGSVPVY
jgi:diaminopropionate ammonia-lyase